MLNQNLTKEEALWLLNEFQPKMGGRISGDTMDKYFLPARALMTGKPANKPSCGCEFKAYAQISNSMFGQYKTEIEAIAYPPVVIEPSEIIEEAVVEIQTLPNEIRTKTRKRNVQK